MAGDLGRWSDGKGAPSELTALLKAAKADVPSQAELTGLEASLASLLNAPPPAPAPPAAKPFAGSQLPLAAKLGVLAALGALVGTTAYLTANRPGPGASAPVERTPASTSTSLPQAKPAQPKLQPSASEQPVPEPSQVSDEGAKPAEAALEAQPKPAHGAPKPSEASLLGQAQRALKSDPARALAITREHKRLYPAGALSQEREVIAIEALARLNRKGSAQEKANQFSQKYPESAHQQKVDTLKK